MKHVKKSVLLWYSPHEMYELVTGIKDYPKFLPWCDKAEVLETHEGGMTARLHIHYAGLRHAFTTRNEHVKDSQVKVWAPARTPARSSSTWPMPSPTRHWRHW
jgi:ribosome-associated toxin RatA of RatAB toxin-antitoxin module